MYRDLLNMIIICTFYIVKYLVKLYIACIIRYHIGLAIRSVTLSISKEITTSQIISSFKQLNLTLAEQKGLGERLVDSPISVFAIFVSSSFNAP